MHHNMKLLLLILIFMAKSECLPMTGEDECPEHDAIYPCECSHYGTESFMSCQGNRNDTSIEALQKILRRVSNAPLMDLRIYKYKLEKVPSKLFEGMDIIELVLSGNEIHSFESEAGSPVFSGLEDKLQKLFFYNNIREPHIYNFTWKLDHLRKLEVLEFSDNRDNQYYYRKYWKLSNDWFENGPTSLREVRLDYNDIESLGDKAFAGLTNLRELEATSNKIKAIQRSMFPNPANKLISIDFSYNVIETLPEDIFSNMPSLERVSFRRNELETLDQRVWEPVWEQLDKLILVDHLVCDSDIDWVFTLKRPSKLEAKCSEHEGDSDKRGKQLDNLIDKRTRRMLL